MIVVAPSVAEEHEMNPRVAAEVRMDEAAARLGLDEGMIKVLRKPTLEVTVSVPIILDDGRIEVFTGYRVQHSLASGPGQGRHPLRSRRHAGRGARAGRVDDLEVRRGEHSVRRRQGRNHLRSRRSFRKANWSGLRAATLPTCIDIHRAGARRAGARHEHQRADHGLDHGHLLHAQAHTVTASSLASRSIWAARAAGRKRPGAAVCSSRREALRHLGHAARRGRAWSFRASATSAAWPPS